MWSCPGNMPQYYPGLKDILPSPSPMPKYYPCLRDILSDFPYAKILPRSERYITLPFGRVICLSDLGNILAYYLDKITLTSLLYLVSNCPGNMPKYYGTKYHYRNLHEV